MYCGIASCAWSSCSLTCCSKLLHLLAILHQDRARPVVLRPHASASEAARALPASPDTSALHSSQPGPNHTPDRPPVLGQPPLHPIPLVLERFNLHRVRMVRRRTPDHSACRSEPAAACSRTATPSPLASTTAPGTAPPASSARSLRTGSTLPESPRSSCHKPAARASGSPRLSLASCWLLVIAIVLVCFACRANS